MRRIALVGALVLAAGCGRKHPADRITYVAEDDPRMTAAVAKARASTDKFVAALRSPKPGQTAFSVKAPFTDGGETEHMWLTPVTFDGKAFQGTVNNEPAKVHTVKLGQRVTVEAGKISDWMYLEKGKLVGGHTLRVLRDTMPAAERAEFDKTVPFVID